VPDVSFDNLLIVLAVGFLVPLALGLVPRLRLPGAALEILAGIIVGPAVLGWVDADLPVTILALLGLGFLLLLSGLEIDLHMLRGPIGARAATGFAVTLALGLLVGVGAGALDLTRSPLLIAVLLSATSLGVVVALLKDTGEAGSPTGQLVLAGSSIADLGAVILLSLLFSGEDSSAGAKIVLLGGFVVFILVVAVVVIGSERSSPISMALRRLQDTTAQIRVRGAVLLLIVFVTVAEHVGLEAILGAFVAGMLLGALDPDTKMTHPQFRVKLEAIGFGFLIPVYFVTSGIRFDLHALTSDVSVLARVPLYLAALLVVRGLPALLYRPLVGSRRAAAAGLLQATSLPFIVAGTQIGQELGLLTAANGAALVAAGLVSVLVFPLAATSLLRVPEASEGFGAVGRLPVLRRTE
jgi:Kef-type K+ transport system membrane component KefB